MVALNKTYLKTLTPDRSAKDSGHRFYSPEISRWLSRDPVETTSHNSYAFVENDPVDRLDVVGLFSKILNCCPCEENVLKSDEQIAQQQIKDLRQIIKTWIQLIQVSPNSNEPKPGYPQFIISDLKFSVKVLDKAAVKLDKGIAKCVYSPSGGTVASAVPWGLWGLTVSIYEPYWWWVEKARAATLVHEGTHLGSGLTDGLMGDVYFWQQGNDPYNTFFLNFTLIAGTYDTWILKGFCLPGYDGALGPGHGRPCAMGTGVPEYQLITRVCTP
jgi:RHS repeat-associated protein